MDRKFWLERWEQKRIGFHEPGVNAHLQAFWPRLVLPASTKVFVPLCGKSSDLLWLRAQGHEVLGVEWSPVAVRDFFSENGLEPRRRRAGAFEEWSSDGVTLWCGDFFDLVPADLDGVGAVYDRASLIALPTSTREAYANQMVRVLPPVVPMLLITLEYDQSQMQGPPFAVHEPEVRALYEPHRGVRLLYELDVLDDSPRFRARGLTQLHEKVYGLEPRTDGG
jgi:thiopurine S-methyltransferase